MNLDVLSQLTNNNWKGPLYVYVRQSQALVRHNYLRSWKGYIGVSVSCNACFLAFGCICNQINHNQKIRSQMQLFAATNFVHLSHI